MVSRRVGTIRHPGPDPDSHPLDFRRKGLLKAGQPAKMTAYVINVLVGSKGDIGHCDPSAPCPLLAEAVEKVVCSVRLDVIPLANDLAGGYGDDG